MELKLLHFYPDLMSLYGSYANLALLRRHLEDLGNTVTVETVRPGRDADLGQADFLFMGAGTERSQLAALADFRRCGETVKALAADGVVQLYAGTAMELLGKSIVTADRQVHQGIGLADFLSEQGHTRFVGDVYGMTDLSPAPVVGFMNKCAVIRGVETPLLERCLMGMGNETRGGAEGYHRDNVFASELTGPLLVKNPALLRAVIDALYRRRGQSLPEALPRYPHEEASYATTEHQLRLRLEKS